MDEMTSRVKTLRTVVPLLIVNALAVYGQLAYAMENVAPTGWLLPARVALSIGFAAAVESVALYVGWHAHDALLLKSHATARNLRRASYVIALGVAAMNYSHFAADGMHPTAAACAFGLLSLLTPWLWGLHTRRAAHLQLIQEHRADESGAEFSSARRRAFPILSWKARRYSIMHNITDPAEAWTAFLASREPVPSVPVPSVPVPSVPVQRRPRPSSAPVSGGPVPSWDMDKVVRKILDKVPPAEILATVDNVSAKNLQRTRRVVEGLLIGQSDELVRGDITAQFVQRVRKAMA